MRLVCISDTHGYHKDVSIPDGDFLIHAGDYCDDGDQLDTISFLKWFESQHHAHKVFTSGNHDLFAEAEPTLFRELIKEFAPSTVYLEDSGATIGGLTLYGSPVTPRFFDWAFNRDRGEAIKRHWDLIPSVDVLITHGPALGYHDWSVHTRAHEGDADLLEAIKRVKPKVHICGHFHRGWGTDKLVHDDGSVTTMINASICTESYKPIHAPWVINL